MALLWAGFDARAAELPEPLRSIAEIQSLSNEELKARRPAVIRGVITLNLSRRTLVVEDAGDAVFCLLDDGCVVDDRVDDDGSQPAGLAAVTCPP